MEDTLGRAGDWLGQARDDLQHARHALAAGDHNWACFAAQQAAEKAVKAVFLARNLAGWGHVVVRLLDELRDEIPVPDGLRAGARRLDQYYIPTRYPNGFDGGKPSDFYDAAQAAEAIRDAEGILRFCEGAVGPAAGG